VNGHKELDQKQRNRSRDKFNHPRRPRCQYFSKSSQNNTLTGGRRTFTDECLAGSTSNP
jgi:hypothetical protein